MASKGFYMMMWRHTCPPVRDLFEHDRELFVFFMSNIERIRKLMREV